MYISDLAAWCNISFGSQLSNPLYYAHHLYLNGMEIKELVIPNGMTNINDNAFIGCMGLTSLNIPESVTSIASYAFKDCTGLTSITCLNPTPPTCTGNDPFAIVDHTIPVYVPQGSVLNYKAADIWRNFVVFREIGGDADGVLLTIKDGGNGKTQLLVDESKPYFTLFFKADSGWKLHSVTFNGDDVTPEVGSDGNYTTSALTSSSTINVVYQQTSQSINAVSNSSVQVKACNGEIVISSDDSSAIPVIIYNIDGKVVGRETIMGGEAHITLPIENIYVIKAGGQTFKVSL